MFKVLTIIFFTISMGTLLALLFSDVARAVKAYFKAKPKVTITTKTAQKNCAICGDGNWEFSCRCGTSYHRECWNGLRRCATLGCSITNDEMRQRIAKRAYYLYCESGCKHGQDKQNWIEAERRILSGTL